MPTASRTSTTVEVMFLRTDPAVWWALLTESWTSVTPRSARALTCSGTATVGRSTLGSSIFGSSNFGTSNFGNSNLEVLVGVAVSVVFFAEALAVAVFFFAVPVFTPVFTPEFAADFSADFTLADGLALVAVGATFFLGVVFSLMMRPCSREPPIRWWAYRQIHWWIRRLCSPPGMRRRSAAAWCAAAR